MNRGMASKCALFARLPRACNAFCTLICLLTYFMTLNRPCFIFITLPQNVSLGRVYL